MRSTAERVGYGDRCAALHRAEAGPPAQHLQGLVAEAVIDAGVQRADGATALHLLNAVPGIAQAHLDGIRAAINRCPNCSLSLAPGRKSGK